MAHVTHEQLTELRLLRNQSMAIVEWLAAHGHLVADGADFKEALAEAFALRHLHEMRLAARDLRDMAYYLPPQERRSAFAAVEEATGVSPASEDAKDAAAIARVMARGRIRNDREYCLLCNRLDRIEGDPTHTDDEAQLKRLLAEFGH